MILTMYLSTASVKMPDLNVSVSHTKTQPTTTHVQVAETSWYASSSAVPPSTPPQGKFVHCIVHVFILFLQVLCQVTWSIYH